MLSVEFNVDSFENAQKIGILFISAVQDVLSGERHGRYYPLSGNPFFDRLTPKENRAPNYYVKFIGAKTRQEIPGSAYQASAPGEPPAVRTGRLRQSFYMAISMIIGGYKVKISTNVVYADDLEYGTERVAPRPFIEPAVQKILPQIADMREKSIYKMIRE